MANFEPLAEYCREQTFREFGLPFHKIEAIIGDKLPVNFFCNRVLRRTPMTNKIKACTATALAALGLANLSPAQWALGGAVVGAGMVATPALAQALLPGVGIVIKKKPGNAPIIAPTDKDGVIRMTGLEPGEYEVSLIAEERVTTVTVGRDGELFIRAVAEDDGSNRRVENLNGPRQTPEIAALRGGGFFVAILAAAARGRTIDVNASSAAEIGRIAPTTSRESAAFIVAERTRGGAFKDLIDFANRVCPKTGVDFDLAPTRIGNTQIFARGGAPKSNGFKCAPPRAGETPTFELYGRKHTYVGHVTLLR